MQHSIKFSHEPSEVLLKFFGKKKKEIRITWFNVYLLRPKVKHSVHLLGWLLILFELIVIVLLAINYGSSGR